jgi:hypothetical protein
MRIFGEILESIGSIGASMGVQLICALIAAAIMSGKGKPWLAGAFLGFFLGPIGVFIAFFVANSGPRPRRSYAYTPQASTVPARKQSRTYRLPGRCPHCNGPVHAREASQPSASCWYCGAEIEATPVD